MPLFNIKGSNEKWILCSSKLEYSKLNQSPIFEKKQLLNYPKTSKENGCVIWVFWVIWGDGRT